LRLNAKVEKQLTQPATRLSIVPILAGNTVRLRIDKVGTALLDNLSKQFDSLVEVDADIKLSSH
jgi:hypothetical protein